MDADILQAIRIIDAKIASLQEARDRLASAFGIDLGPSTPSSSQEENQNRDFLFEAPRATRSPSGRKVELAEFLLAHGSMSRGEILEKAGMPEGTVAYCLNDKRFFEQSDDGKWHITEFSKRGLERKERTGSFQEG